MAGTDISNLTGRLSRKNQDIIGAIRSGVSEKRRAITSLRINFNNSKSELASTKQSINNMNVQQLNDKSIEVSDRIKQATALLESLLSLDSEDEAVSILQRTIRLMNNEYNYISNRLKGSIIDYNNINRGIVELSKRVRRPISSSRPVMVNTSTITGLPISLYNKDKTYKPIGKARSKVTINRVGNFAVTRLATPITNSTNSSNINSTPNLRVSQTIVRNELEHNEWRKSFFKNFEDDRNRNFKEVIKALKALKFSALPVPGSNNKDIDFPDIPDNKEKENKGSDNKSSDSKNRTTDTRSRGLKTGLALGGSRRALEEASSNFVDMDGNPIKDEYGNNPLQYVFKKGVEVLQTKTVEDGFQGIRSKVRGFFGLTEDTSQSAIVEPGKTEVKDSTPLVSSKDIDVVKSEVVIDERMLNDILKKLLGIGSGSSNNSNGGNNAADGGSNRGSITNSDSSNNSSNPTSVVSNSSENNPSSPTALASNEKSSGKTKSSIQATPPVENKDKGNTKASIEQPTARETSPKADTVSPIVPDKETPKASNPSDVTGGLTAKQKDSARAKPEFNTSQIPATSQSIDTKPSPTSVMPSKPSDISKPNMPPSSTNISPPSKNTNQGSSPVVNNSDNSTKPAIDLNKTATGDIPKAPDDNSSGEISLDELEVSPDTPPPPPPKATPSRTKTSYNSDKNSLVSQASFNPSATSAASNFTINNNVDFNNKKQEAWINYQNANGPKSDESLPDYMKRRETLGLSNGGVSETEAQPSNNPYINRNNSNIITPNTDSSDNAIEPNVDSVGAIRVPYKPPRAKEYSPEPTENYNVDTSAPDLGSPSSTVDSTVTNNNYGFSKQDTPKSIIRAENLGMVQIDGEYLT